MPDQNSLMERIVTLESSMMHLQLDLEKISQVVLDQQKQLEIQQIQIERWEEKITGTQESLPDPLDEKPPHY